MRSVKLRRRLDPVHSIEVGGLISDGQIRRAGAPRHGQEERRLLFAVDRRGRVWQGRRGYDGGWLVELQGSVRAVAPASPMVLWRVMCTPKAGQKQVLSLQVLPATRRVAETWSRGGQKVAGK